MGRIDAGANFGQAVAQPTRMNEVATPRAAFGNSDALEQTGQALQADGAQRAREAQVLEQRRIAADVQQQLQVKERADAAMAQAKLLGLRDRLADTLDEIDRGVQDGTIAKDDAPVAWKERSGALISDGLPDFPEAHRALAQTDLTGLADRMSSKVVDAIRARDRSDIRSSIDATLEHAQRLATTDPERARAIVDATLQANGPAAGLKPEVVQKLRQQWVEGTAFTRAYTAVNAAKGNNAQLDVVERALAENTELDPQRKATLLTQIGTFRAHNDARAVAAAQRAEILAARAQRESDSAFSTLSAWVLSGRMPNPDAAAGLIGKLTPQAAAAYRAMAAEVPARTAAAMLPLNQQEQQLDALYARVQREGTSQPLEEEIKRREQVLTQARQDYAKEPLRAGQERGIFDQPLQPLDLTSAEGFAAGITQRVEQARTVQTRTGRPVSPLLTDEAERMGRMLSALPIAQRAERVQQIATMLPPEQGQALAGQLVSGESEEKRALGIAFALGAARTTNGRATSELALKGAEALKAKTIKEERTPVDGWRGQIATQLQDVYASPQQAQMATEAARLILAGLVAEGASGSSGDAKQAVRLAIGGSLPELNGARIVVPAGLDVRDVRKRLETLTPADLAKQAPDGQVYIGGQPMAVADFLARLPDAQLQTVGRGRYVVKSGGTYAANVQRRPIVIEVAP